MLINMVLHEHFVLPANGSGPEQIHAIGSKRPTRNSNRQATIDNGDGKHPVLQSTLGGKFLYQMFRTPKSVGPVHRQIHPPGTEHDLQEV
jgi:hypothetical protein